MLDLIVYYPKSLSSSRIKFFGLIFFAFFFKAHLLAQDSPEERINSLIEASIEYSQSRQFEAALLSIEKADSLLLVKKTISDSLKGVIEYRKGVCFYNLARYKEALSALERALAVFLEEDYNGQVADCYLLLGNVYWYTDGASKALEYFDLAISYARRDQVGRREYRGRYYVDKGYALLYLGDFKEGRLLIEKGVELDINHFGFFHMKTTYALTVEGTFHLHNEDYYQAQECFSRVEEVLDSILVDKQSPDYGVTYGNLGKIYFYLNQFNKAEKYFQKALYLFERTLVSNHPNLLLALISLGEIYSNLGEYEKSIHYYSLARETGSENLAMIDIAVLIGTAQYFGGNGKYEAAEEYLLEAEKLILKNNDKHLKDHAFVLELLGENAINRKDHKEAVIYFERAIKGYKALFGNHHNSVARIYAYLGRSHLQMENVDSGLQNLENGLAILWEPHQNFEKIQSADVWSLLVDLRSKALSFKASSDRDSVLQREALRGYYLIEGYYNYLRKNFGAPEDKQLIASYAAGNYKAMVKTASKLFTIEPDMKQLAYKAVERSKAHALLEGILNSGIVGLDSLYQEAVPVRERLDYYRLKLYDAESSGEYDDITIARWKSIIFDLEQQLDQIRESISSSYPIVFESIDENTYTTVLDVQKDLEPNNALLEYFVGDSSIFIFRIEKDKYEVKEVKRDFPLEEWVKQLRDNISQPLPFAYEAYLEVAPKLYEKLVAPVAEGLPERLVIVPDGILGYIPFEALLMAKPDANNLYAAERLPYLLREHQVSYCYSATLLREMKEKKHRQTPKREMLAVAPFTTVDTVLSSHLDQSDWLASTRSDTLLGLPYSKAEVDSIQKIFKTDAFYGAEASEAAFVDRAGDYRILHLSTHGKADARVGDYSYLAFYPQPDSLENELLYVRDLYNLQLNADLVVLSACETGTGELQQGEGIISLARAFAYAGAKSIATTLWQVNDQSTQELMVRFYRYLKSGMTKDAALRQAKLDYLDGHNDTGAYPFYWAAFIGVGDMGRF
jgi:CHAT domain-containing protein